MNDLANAILALPLIVGVATIILVAGIAGMLYYAIKRK